MDKMRTLGVDMASQPDKTAACAIHWESGMAFVETPEVGLEDMELVERMRGADCTAIDAPFGWPDAVVAAIAAYADFGTWPAEAVPERLRYRATEWFVHDYIAHEQRESVRPLSVSSDRIAVSAWRCARLLTDFARTTGWKLDRVGAPPHGTAAPAVVEAYPAAALAMWGLPFRGYKQTTSLTASDAAEKRALVLRMLGNLARRWLLFSESAHDVCVESDDAFDALICSLVACAAATGQTVPPPTRELHESAQREGWIQLPTPVSIEALAPLS